MADTGDELRTDHDYKAMIEHSLQGILIVQGQRILFTNPAGGRITGYSQEDLLAFYPVKLDDIIHPDDLEGLYGNIKYCLDTRSPFRQELRIRQRDGATRWIELVADRVLYHGKASIQIACIDISRRREVEDNLHFMQFIIDHHTDAVIWAAPGGNLTYVNESACRQLGYGREELLALSLPDIAPDLAAAQWEELWQALRRQGSVVREQHLRTKDGRIFPVEIAADNVMFNGREFCCAFVRTITRRKQVEARLQASEERFRVMFNSTTDGMILVDAESYRFHYVNQAVCVMLGHQQEALLTMSLEQICPPEHSAYILDQLCRLSRMEIPLAANIPLKHRDGTLFFVDMLAPRIELEDGSYLLCVFRDTTERNSAQIALRESEARLRSIVEGAPLGIHLYLQNENGKLHLKSSNAAADRILGVNAEQLIGKPLAECLSDLATPAIVEELETIAAKGGSWQDRQLTGQVRQSVIFEAYAFQIAAGLLCVMFMDCRCQGG